VASLRKIAVCFPQGWLLRCREGKRKEIDYLHPAAKIRIISTSGRLKGMFFSKSATSY